MLQLGDRIVIEFCVAISNIPVKVELDKIAVALVRGASETSTTTEILHQFSSRGLYYHLLQCVHCVWCALCSVPATL